MYEAFSAMHNQTEGTDEVSNLKPSTYLKTATAFTKTEK
jgi:hypothetical protein